MKIAFLGGDQHLLRLASAIAEAPDHELTAVFEGNDAFRKSVREAGNRPSFEEHWESALHGSVADVVIVASDPHSTQRPDQLRKLVAAKVPTIVMHPGCEAIIGYELDMIRQDTQSLLAGYVPGQEHPLMRWLVQAVDGGDPQLGRVEQLAWDVMARGNDRKTALAELARDAELTRHCVGRITRVSAIGGEADKTWTNNLTVTLTTERGVLVRWSMLPARTNGADALTVVGDRDTARLEFGAAPNLWRRLEQTEADAWDEGAAMLSWVERTCQTMGPSSWPEVCQSLEVADCAEVSLRRSRTIDLIHEPPTEESTFKGVMAAGSCGLLVLTLVILLVGSVIEGLRSPTRRQQVDRLRQAQKEGDDTKKEDVPRRPLLVRLWPVYPFALFLALQLLRIFTRPPKPPTILPGTRTTKVKPG